MAQSVSTTPRSGLTKHQTRSTLEAFYLNAGVRAVFDVICTPTGLMMTTFALALGIPGERLGIISSVVYAACVLQLVAIGLNRRVRDKKKFVLALMLIEPLILIGAVVALPYLPPEMRLIGLAWAAFVSVGTLHMSRPVLDDWMAASIPAPLRGRYVGSRTQALSAVTMVVTMGVGFTAEALSPKDAPYLMGLALVLAAGGVFGFLAAIPLRAAALPQATEQAQADWSDLPGVFRHRPFRRFLIGILITAAPFAFSLHYYQVFAIDVLQMDKRYIAYISVTYMTVKIAVLPLIGRRLVRWGPRRTLRCSAYCYVFFFLCYPLTAMGGGWLVAAAWVIAALGDSFWAVAQSSGIYACVPQSRDRPAYFAVFNLLVLGMYALGGWASVYVIEAMRGMSVNIGPYVLGQYHLYYLGCAAAMVPCLIGPGFLMGRREMREYDDRAKA